MCDIGTPIEIIDVQPLNLPAPLPGRREIEQPEPVVVPVPVVEPTFAFVDAADQKLYDKL